VTAVPQEAEYDAATLQAMEDSPEDWDPVFVGEYRVLLRS
jgi:hypothetical protein